MSAGYPPFSRLFIIGDKKATEEDYKNSFGKYGTLMSVTFIKDRNGENKGIVYIQMSKTSEACKAVDSLNGVSLTSNTRQMKVLIATNRSESISDEDIMAQVSRLFVVVPKSLTEEDIVKIFQEYGAIKKVVTIRDKKTNESKGLAFVTFMRPYDAAIAYEMCSSDYKPKFADPVSRKRQHDDGDGQYERHSDRRSKAPMERMGSLPPNRNMAHTPSRDEGPTEFLANYPNNDQYYLKVRVPKGLTQHQLTRLFNIVPTLEFCKLATNQYNATDIAIIGYSSAGCCAYAKEAFHGFEYPPGCPLEIEYYSDNNDAMQSTQFSSSPMMNNGGFGSGYSGGSYSGGTTGYGGSSYGASNGYEPKYRYSNTYGYAESSSTRKRLFIVSQPDRISVHVLTDMFSKFGNLVSVNYIPGKNYGFAKFSSEDSADRAQKYMHGETISGNHLKCLDAEDPPPDHKKSRM